LSKTDEGSDDDFEEDKNPGSLKRQYLTSCGRVKLIKLANEAGVGVAATAKKPSIIEKLLRHVGPITPPPSTPTTPLSLQPLVMPLFVPLSF
jgi:hypothetical protein